MTRKKPTYLSSNEKYQMVFLYAQGMSSSKLADLYNVDPQTVLNTARKYGFTKTLSDAHRLYPINETAFDKINTEEGAYWLGFICADGCVYKNVLSISLKSSDASHLDKMKSFLNTDIPLYDYDTGLTSLRVTSKHMVDALSVLGVHSQKSLSLNRRPPQIPDHLVRHFYRGYVDGDGWIGITVPKDQKKPRPNFTVVATQPFLEELQEWLIFELPQITSTKIHKHGPIFAYSKRSGLQTPDLLSLLYESSKVHLDRKKEIVHFITSGEYRSE